MTARSDDRARILRLESLAERRQLAIEAQLRRLKVLEEKIARRDDRIISLQGQLRTARARLRRIAAIAGRGSDRKEPRLLERAIGD